MTDYMVESLFKLRAARVSARGEVLAGLTTFLTMASILFVNPDILAQAGMDHGAVFVATCLAAAIGSAVMGLLANYPDCPGAGHGINAFLPLGWSRGWGCRGGRRWARCLCRACCLCWSASPGCAKALSTAFHCR